MPFSNVFQEGLLVRLHVCQWPAQVQLSPDDLDIDAKAVEHPQYKFALGRKFLIPKAEVDKIRAIELAGRRVISARSVIYPVGDLPFVPKDLLGEVIEGLDDMRERFHAAVEDMLGRYVDLAHKALRNYTNIAQRIWEVSRKSKSEKEFVDSFISRIRVGFPGPKALKGRYSFEYTIFALSAADGKNSAIEALDVEAAKRCRRELEVQTRRFLEDAVRELRQRTFETFSSLATRVAEGQIVSEGTLASLRSFIADYEKLNFVGDRTISQTLAEFGAKYLNRGAKEIRTEEALKQEFQQALDGVAQRAADMTDISKVTGRIRRKLEL